MRKALRPLFIIAMIVGLSITIGLTVAQVGGMDPQTNPPRDPTTGPDGGNDPGGGLCPNPWPVTVTVTGFSYHKVRIQSAASEPRRSITRTNGNRLDAVVCRDDAIAFDALALEGTGIRITNNFTEPLRLEWKYDDGSSSTVITLQPGGSRFHALDSNFEGVELLDPEVGVVYPDPI